MVYIYIYIYICIYIYIYIYMYIYIYIYLFDGVFRRGFARARFDEFIIRCLVFERRVWLGIPLWVGWYLWEVSCIV